MASIGCGHCVITYANVIRTTNLSFIFGSSHLVSWAGDGLDAVPGVVAGVPGSEEVEVVALARPRLT